LRNFLDRDRAIEEISRGERLVHPLHAPEPIPPVLPEAATCSRKSQSFASRWRGDEY
jgi:hypothetical protein